MAYDTDTMVKNTLRDISRNSRLKNLELRCFDESNEDQKHWTEGGLTFGPKTCLHGSNDAGWFLRKPFISDGNKISDWTPVLIVEGSYGTEVGNTGSAQYARFSHALGAAKDGFIGVYFIPFQSTYRKADGTSTTAFVRYDMIYAALNVCKQEEGEYLFMDAYDKQLMVEFLKVLDGGDDEKRQLMISKIKSIMKEFADAHTAGNRRLYLYKNQRVGKMLMFNVVAFSSYNYRTKTKYRAGRFRNGHTIVGDALINRYWHMKPLDMVFPRFTHEDCMELDKLHQKEWLLLRQTEDISVVTLDDLVFADRQLKNDLHGFLDELPLLGSSLKKKNELSRRILDGFRSSTIKVDYKSVEENAPR